MWMKEKIQSDRKNDDILKDEREKYDGVDNNDDIVNDDDNNDDDGDRDGDDDDKNVAD